MARSMKIRWLSAALGAALTISGVALLAGRAGSSPHLPQITTQQLLASVERAAGANQPISGEVRAHIGLGVPSVSDELSRQVPGASAILSYLTGDHRVRVWHSADGVRVADLLTAGERALFVSRRDAWAWDSQSYTAYHLGPFPPDSNRTTMEAGLARVAPDPTQLAAQALKAIDKSTVVSLGPQWRVAGRDAYVLVLQPRTDQTLVGRVEVSVDGARRVPLSVAIFARNSTNAAVSVAFTSVSFDAIKPSTFEFTPPAGAHVVRKSGEAMYTDRRETTLAPGIPGASSVRVFGKDWSEVLAVRLPAASQLAQGTQRDSLAQLLPFSGTLFSVRLVDRGDHSWLVGGFVPQSTLVKVQAELP